MRNIPGLLLVVSALAFSQGQVVTTSGSSAVNAAGQFSGSMSFSPMRFAPPAVQGAPYSGEEVQEQHQTLSDGTHISRPSTRRMMYRDSQGRTRVERPLMMALMAGTNRPNVPSIVEITDPILGVQYTLDAQHKIAHRVTLQPFPTRPNSTVSFTGTRAGAPVPAPATGGLVGGGGGAALSAPAPARAVAVRTLNTEKLGTQIIDGILAEGQRQTMTIPEGSQGNDRDIHVVTEIWTSPDLHMVIYRKSTDPRSGDSIMHFTNLNRAEPDPQLFMVPVDYQVVDETGPFTIQYGQ